MQSILTTFRLSGRASSLKSLLSVLCNFVWNFCDLTPFIPVFSIFVMTVGIVIDCSYDQYNADCKHRQQGIYTRGHILVEILQMHVN